MTGGIEQVVEEFLLIRDVRPSLTDKPDVLGPAVVGHL